MISFTTALNTDLLYRRLAVIVMMTVFFAQTFSSCFIVADYYANTQAFAQNCINKARPELHCNGKCQMQKQVGNEEKKDQQMPERKDGKNEVVLIIHSSYLLTNLSYANPVSVYPSLITGKEAKMPRSLFRPPLA